MFKVGQTVILKNTEEAKSYLGRYAGTDAKILSIHTSAALDVIAYDGVKFMVPNSYVTSPQKYYGSDWLPEIPSEDFKCDCGGEHTSTKQHYGWCSKGTIQ